MAAHKIPIGHRLFSRLQVRGSCWVWTGAKDQDGYGLIKIAGKMERLPRFIFKALNGEIPKGHLICHRCDNPPCFRPSHLFAATAAENQKDKVRKNRQAKGDRHGFRLHPECHPQRKKTACKHGHPFDAQNTTISRGTRCCKACWRMRARKRRDINRGVRNSKMV